jgi:hypothetical protein
MPNERTPAIDAPNAVIAFRRDGLGGRLHNLLWSWRFGRALGIRTIVYWDSPLQSHIQFFGADYRAANIFDLGKLYANRDHDDLMFVDGPPVSLENVHFVDQEPLWNKRARTGWSASELAQKAAFVGYNSYRAISVKGEPIEGDTQVQQVRRLFQSLPLNPIVASRVAELEEGLGSDNLVAVHFRRGDIVAGVASGGKKSIAGGKVTKAFLASSNFYFRKCGPFESFCRKIETYISEGRKVIIFSDDEDAYKKFSERLGTESIVEVGSRLGDLLQIQTDFIEMMLLSKCKTILSTNSGFRQTAQLISGAECELINSSSTFAEYVAEYLELSGFLDVPVDSEVAAELRALLLASPTFVNMAAACGAHGSLDDRLKDIWEAEVNARRGQPAHAQLG